MYLWNDTMEVIPMRNNLIQHFSVTLAFLGAALLTAVILGIPAVERALGLSAWANEGYEGGLAYILAATVSGLVVDLLRLAATHWLADGPLS